MDLLKQTQDNFRLALEHLRGEFSRLQIGRASAALVENLNISAYGSVQPLKSLAGISIPDAKTVQIQPWDKGISGDIEKAIQTSGLNINPVNDGNVIRLIIPALTQERRQDLVKVVYKMAEETKIVVRNHRQTANQKLKDGEKKKEITEDQLHQSEKELQQKVDETNREIEELAKRKEKDIMSL